MFPPRRPGQLLHSCLRSGFVRGKRSLVARLQVPTFWGRKKTLSYSPDSLSRRG